MSYDASGNGRNTELHGWLKELKRDAIHIKELHWPWEKHNKSETSQENIQFRSIAENIIEITIKIQNKFGINTQTTCPILQERIGKRRSFRRKPSKRNDRQKTEKEDTTRGYQPLTGDRFHEILKSLKADTITLKKLYKKCENKGTELSDDQDFRECAGRITFYSSQIQNSLGLVDFSSSNSKEVTNSSSAQYPDMDRGQKRKRAFYSPDRPDNLCDQKASGSHKCTQCEHFKREDDRFFKRNEELNQQQSENQKELTKRRSDSARNSESQEELRRSLDRLQNQLTSERKAKEDALRRLATEAERKLFDNNPDITDLSDPNRPMKLAERMSELYDNEWTTALENLTEKRMTEVQAIQYLLNILIDIYLFCENAANGQFSGILPKVAVPEKALQYSSSTKLRLSEPPADFYKIMKDYRKKNWACAVPLLQMAFKEQKNDSMIGFCKNYVDESMKLCWLMKVQDPPVHMEWNYSNGNSFDTSVFRTYTKTGNVIDFLVWPILFIHKNGPLLSKGIAQGKKTEQRQASKQATLI